MEQEKAEKIIKVYDWIRYVLIGILLTFLFVAASQAQNNPQIHGILRGKYEYQPEMSASRFEVRNARLWCQK